MKREIAKGGRVSFREGQESESVRLDLSAQVPRDFEFANDALTDSSARAIEETRTSFFSSPMRSR